MTRPLRCRLGLHKWVVTQDSSDGPRYHSCRYCGKIPDLDKRPFIGLGGS
jgi:hypothetical protein